ncbi:MAG: TetR/AcrR family transcriptional regulator [Terracidiphilus sp.]
MAKSHSFSRPRLRGSRAAPAPAARPPVGRRQRRSAETRVRLFRTALELIAERGLANVTVEDITEAADVGKGTFFNYFPSKDHVLGVMAEIQVGKVRQAAAQAAGIRQSIRGVLHRLVRRLAEEPGRSPRLARAFISSFLGSDQVREIVKRNMRQGRKTIAGVIELGQQRGEVRPELNKDKVAVQLVQAVMGTVLLWSLHEKPSLAKWMENSFEHAWRAIAASGKE